MRSVKSIIILFTLLVSTLACNLPILPADTETQTPTPITFLMVTNNPNATRTPTPFQPATQTPKVTATTASKVTNLPAGSTVPPTQANAPATAKPQTGGKYPAGQVRIMVLGSDSRGEAVARTDIMMMVSITPSTGTVTVLSFPRDLWVNLPGVGMNRLNTAMVYGGFNLLAATLENNFGIRPTHFMLTTFRGFTSIVDSVGGVDVTAAMNLTDVCALPQAVRGYCSVKAGVNHMNGATALWYVRSRYSTSDFDRERRSQEVLQALFQKLIKLNTLTKIPEFFDIYKKNVETNVTLQDVINLSTVAPGLIANPSRLRRYTISGKEVWNYVVPGSGAQVLIPNEPLIQQIIQQAVFTP